MWSTGGGTVSSPQLILAMSTSTHGGCQKGLPKGSLAGRGLENTTWIQSDRLGLVRIFLRIPRTPSVAAGYALTVISALTLLPLDRKWVGRTR